MVKIISYYDLFTINQNYLFKPIIYCFDIPNSEKKIISLNTILADKLVKYNINKRTLHIEDCLKQEIEKYKNDIIIKDFDILFNPVYQFDILRCFINICRTKPFDVIWPGKYYNGKLYYAQENYIDYKIYNLDNYDITLIIKGE